MRQDGEPAGGRNPGRRTDRSFNLFLVIACLALAALVVVLAWQNRQLKEQLATPAVGSLPPDSLAEGDTLEDLPLTDEAGHPFLVAFGDAEPETLLLFFSPTCPPCKDTFPIWNELLDNPPESLRIVGVNVHPRQGDLPVLRFPVYAASDLAERRLARLRGTPATVLIASDGTVEHVWYGVPGDAALTWLRAAL